VRQPKPSPAQAGRFRRADADRSVRKPRRRRLPAWMRQILALSGLAAVVFFALTEILLFLLSWKDLEIKKVRISSSNSAVLAAAQAMAAAMPWGNILALDIGSVRKRFEADRWIREARVRKVLPSTVLVEVEARVPGAILEKAVPTLIDAEGFEIEPAPARAGAVFPKFEDAGRFDRDAADKIRLGWNCLHELAPEDRADVEALDLTATDDVVLKFRSSPVLLKLGDSGFGPKVSFYREKKSRWAREFGEIEYLDFRIAERVYLKTAAAADPAAAAAPGAEKEAR
jgi:cell division septal protein FtsQ